MKRRQQRAVLGSNDNEILRLDDEAVLKLTMLCGNRFDEFVHFKNVSLPERRRDPFYASQEFQLHVLQNSRSNIREANREAEESDGIARVFQLNPEERFFLEVFTLREDGAESLSSTVRLDARGGVFSVSRTLIGRRIRGDDIEQAGVLYTNDPFTDNVHKKMHENLGPEGKRWLERVAREKEKTRPARTEHAREVLVLVSKVIKGSSEELPLEDVRNMHGAGRNNQPIVPAFKNPGQGFQGR